MNLEKNAASGFWEDVEGREYIKCEFVPTSPFWIEVHEDRWCVRYQGITHNLIWYRSLEGALRDTLKQFAFQRVQKNAPSCLSEIRQLVRYLDRAQVTLDELSDLQALRLLWDTLPSMVRIYLREFVRYLDTIKSLNEYPVAQGSVAVWKARKNVVHLRNVLSWDPSKGALSTAELEVLRQALSPVHDRGGNMGEELNQHHARVFTRVLLDTAKRTQQIATIPSDGLKIYERDGIQEAFLLIPSAKFQAGRPPRLIRIPLELSADIESYRKKMLAEASVIEDAVLLPEIVRKDGELVAQASCSASIFSRINKYVAAELISPRTGESMKVNQRRIRHTVPTQMAMQGYSRGTIQDVLEHDSPSSAGAYIDAIGQDLSPAFESVEMRLGGKFQSLKDAWFKGKMVSSEDQHGPSVFVPDVKAPAVVGSCASKVACPSHPLFGCYTCPSFLAFKEADHSRALDFVEGEYMRWRATEHKFSRSRALKDHERIAASIREVIELVEAGE